MKRAIMRKVTFPPTGLEGFGGKKQAEPIDEGEVISVWCFKHEEQVELENGECPDNWCDFDCDARGSCSSIDSTCKACAEVGNYKNPMVGSRKGLKAEQNKIEE